MRLLIWIFFLIPVIAFAEDQSIVETAKRLNMSVERVKEFVPNGCDSGRPYEQYPCIFHGFVVADMRLNEYYTQLIAELKTKAAKAKLRVAQNAWISFRDKACEFEADGYSNGQDSGTVVVSCKATYTDARADQLKSLIGCGTDYGCPGTR